MCPAAGRGADLPLLPKAFRETVLAIRQRLEARVSVPCLTWACPTSVSLDNASLLP